MSATRCLKCGRDRAGHDAKGMCAPDHPAGGYSFSMIGVEPDFLRTLSVEFTAHNVDPTLLGILTGGVVGAQPPPTFALEMHAPIKRTFWQWLRRKPRLWNHYYVPAARREDESGE